MIHFYTYYSVGGYKDMYLGNDVQTAERRYYLPLLDIEKNQAIEQNDAVLVAKVERQSTLPSIELLSNENRFGLPLIANKITTHGGFQVVFTHLEDEKFFIVLRGIQGSDKDESGRPIPFLMSFMSNSRDDLPKMRRLAGYFAQYTQSAKKELAEFLHYDPIENGLCFEQAQMLQWLCRIVEKPQYETITLANSNNLQITSEKDEISLLIANGGVSPQYVLGEIGLAKKSHYALMETMVIPKDNSSLAEQYKQEWKDVCKKKKLFLVKIGVAVLTIVTILCIIIKCA